MHLRFLLFLSCLFVNPNPGPPICDGPAVPFTCGSRRTTSMRESQALGTTQNGIALDRGRWILAHREAEKEKNRERVARVEPARWDCEG